MVSNPLVSIITVCFNAAQTLEQTIESVRRQNYPNIEYIIIDGGSTDGTLEIVAKYQNFVDVVVSEPDKGIYDAMNKGISLAKGDLIGILNADDYYLPETVQLVVDRYLRNPACGVFYGNLKFLVDETNGYVAKSEPTPVNLLYRMAIYHPTAFVTREAYRQYGLFSLDYKIAADRELMLRFYVKGAKFCYLDQLLTVMRLGGANDKYYLTTFAEERRLSLAYGANRWLVNKSYWNSVTKRTIMVMLEKVGLATLLRYYKRQKYRIQ